MLEGLCEKINWGVSRSSQLSHEVVAGGSIVLLSMEPRKLAICSWLQSQKKTTAADGSTHVYLHPMQTLYLELRNPERCRNDPN